MKITLRPRTTALLRAAATFMILVGSSTLGLTAPTRYSAIDLGTFYGDNEGESFGYAINDAGVVVGGAQYSGIGFMHAFIYSGGVLTDLGALPGGSSGFALGINAAGQIVGNSESSTGYYHGFTLFNGVMTDLGGLPNSTSTADDINASGHFVGSNGHQAYVRDPSGAVTLLGDLGGYYSAATAINDLGQIAGIATLASQEQHAFLYSGGIMTDLGSLSLGLGNSMATAINNHGHVVGLSSVTGSYFEQVTRAFLFDGNEMLDLGSFGGNWSSAEDINDSGHIVGGATDATGRSRAFIALDGTLYDLNDYVDLDPSIEWLSSANAINASGQIVVEGSVGGKRHAVLLTPIAVPEPGSTVLLLIGVAGTLLRRPRL